jgi:integrase
MKYGNYDFKYTFAKKEGSSLSYLRMLIRWRGDRYWKVETLSYSPGYQIDRKKWDGKRCKGMSRHNGIEAPTINLALEDLERKIADFFAQHRINHTTPTKGEVHDLLHGTVKLGTDVHTAFVDFIHEESAVRSWRFKTITAKFTAARLFKRFRPQLTFNKVTPRLMQDFTQHLSRRKVKNSSIAEITSIVRQFFAWARKKGMIAADAIDWDTPRLQVARRPVIYLTWNELQRVEALTFGDSYAEQALERARDVFIFCCYTSLRISDATALEKSAVSKDYIDVVTQKTTRALHIDLNDHSRRILEKYADSDSDKALPSIVSIEWYNRRLKEIGKRCRIFTPVTIVSYSGAVRSAITRPKYQFLSSHVGRKTFVVNALSMGIPANIVMKWTGHSNYASMMPYIDITNEAKKNAMNKFNSGLPHENEEDDEG